MREDRAVAGAGALRARDRQFGLVDAAVLEVAPGECVLGEDVVTLGLCTFSQRHGLAELPIVIGEKSRELRRMWCVESPAGLRQRIRARGVGVAAVC